MINEWGFFVGLGVVIVALILAKLIFKIKISFMKIIKIAINAIIGYFIIMAFNFVVGFFGIAFTATWWEWLIIGLTGIIGAILCIVFSFIWPGIW